MAGNSPSRRQLSQSRGHSGVNVYQEVIQTHLFATSRGWAAIAGVGDVVTRVWVGFSSEPELSKRVAAETIETGWSPGWITNRRWNTGLADRLTDYFAGSRAGFQDLELAWPRPLSEFRRRSLDCVRQLDYGCTLSYQQLAALAGAPGAARAAGSVMAANRFPIVIPCHRVLASGGKLGGYSGGSGILFKQALLEMEGAWPSR